MRYAEVAVSSPPARRKTFSYTVPDRLSVEVGQAVWVPFGSRFIQGIVFDLSARPLVEETKEIAVVIDPHPLLSPAQVELARWISERYLSPLFAAAALMLPPGFERKVITFVHPRPNPSQLTISSLTAQQSEVLRLLERMGKTKIAEVAKALGQRRAKLVVDQLQRKGLVVKLQELERIKVRPRLIPHLRLAVEASAASQEAARLLASGRKAPKQADLLRLLIVESQPIPLSEARRHVQCSPAVVHSLERRGLLCIEQIEVWRDPLSHRNFAPSVPPVLTQAQETAWRSIQASLTESAKGDGAKPPAVFLLHGVTGSGKTEVYLRALAQAVSLGRRGIVLVPEISLTPQTIDRFASRFPNRVAVLHSRLSLGEQFDEWQRIREGAFDVVIGSRGAIFAPQPNLGLIVIDEEHEWTYKQQESPPRYHARDVAIKLAELTGAVVILGSATPDVTSYYRTQAGDCHLLELPGRITPHGASPLPPVEVVDLKEELKSGNRSIFSRSLFQAISEALEKQDQVILFLNRRGSATFVQCRNCGFVLRCRRCQVSLTYHAAEASLLCHQCNYRARVPQVCPECGSQRIRFLGLGTQKVEEEAARAFAGARLLRWDRDVTKGKHSHEEILDRFLAHQADILIGTQMVAKGLDMPQVTLVGVISADTGLHLPDFRAAERTFQTLCQVAGRAGRGLCGGRVIVQTYTPEHEAIQAAAKHDYAAFYEREISYRRQYHNPPFTRLARLTYSHTSAALGQGEAERMSRLLLAERDSRGEEVDIIGPSPAFIQRLRGRFRWQIILRGPDPSHLLAEVPLPQGWAVDIDPASLL